MQNRAIHNFFAIVYFLFPPSATTVVLSLLTGQPLGFSLLPGQPLVRIDSSKAKHVDSTNLLPRRRQVKKHVVGM